MQIPFSSLDGRALPYVERVVKAFVTVFVCRDHPKAAKRTTMIDEPDTILLPGNPPLTVQWRRSTRAKRMALKVSRLDATVTLTLPMRASRRSGMAFLSERSEWLRAALDGVEGPVVVQSGMQIPIEGQMSALTPAAIRAARLDGAHLFVPQSKPVAGALAYLKLQARDKLAERVGFHARALGRTPGKLTLRDTRSRWGSCTPSGDLMFSWRLIMAPTRILDYVAAHEVAHLAKMNHSAAFWAEVNSIFHAHLYTRH